MVDGCVELLDPFSRRGASHQHEGRPSFRVHAQLFGQQFRHLPGGPTPARLDLADSFCGAPDTPGEFFLRQV
jgi:hypothetical protein